METVLAESSANHRPFSPYKQMKNPKRNGARGRRFISKKPSSENMPKGILLAPPPLSISYSFPPSSHSLYNYQKQQQQQPPLLPLPTHNSLTSRSQYFSCPPPTNNRKPIRARDHSLTPKKSKKPSKREDESRLEFFKPTEKTVATKAISESFIVASVVNPLGPDPTDLPKYVSRFLSAGIVAGKDFDKFSGSAFTVSPPPSSLPLPKFSLRPKLVTCNTEAAGIDAGATDDLRRLLRLR